MKSIKKVSILTLILFLVYLISQNFYYRLDLSEDKRFTLSDCTKKFLKNLSHNVTIDIYLGGDVPINFKKFKDAINEKLTEFSKESKNLSFRFIDIKEMSLQKRKRLFKKLQNKKIYATSIFTKEKGLKVEKIVFPVAKIKCNKKVIYTKLFYREPATSIEILIHKAVQKLEYVFTRSIERCTSIAKKKIAILEGHGKIHKIHLSSFIKNLKKYYKVEYVNPLNKGAGSEIKKEIQPLNNYSALIIIKPTKKFSETAKYLLDQYIMQGGYVLFFLDAVNVNPIRLVRGLDFALPNQINLDDMLFNYGIRINYNLIEDTNCSYHKIVTSNTTKDMNIEWLKWPFAPIITNFQNHIITKNLDAISTKFISSIDSVTTSSNVKKTPLLFSSQVSTTRSFPIKVDINDLRNTERLQNLTGGPYCIAYLLEGNFTSYFKHKFIPEDFDKYIFKDKSIYTKLLVVSSGNLLTNGVNSKDNSPLPLGYDAYYNHTFAQQEFVLNTIDYMINDNKLIFARNKNIKLRLLDLHKIKNNYVLLYIINILLPILVLLIWGFVCYFIFKPKQSK